DPHGVAELGTYCRLAGDLGHPQARWNALSRRVTLALIGGDPDAAAALLVEAAELGVRIGEPDAIGAANTQAFVFAILGRTAPELPIPTSTFGRRVDPVLVAFHQHAHGERRAAAAAMAGYRFADSAHSHDPEPVVLAAVMLAEYGTDDERRQVYEHLLPLAGTH